MKQPVPISQDLRREIRGETPKTPAGKAEPKIRRIEDLPRLSAYGAQKTRFVVPGLLAFRSVTAIASEAGAGKSFFLFWLPWRIVQGASVFGREVAPCPVLYLDRENPFGVIEERAEILGIDRDEPALNYWGVFSPEDPPAPGSPIVADWAQRHPDSVIVVDSQSAFLDGDENSSQDVRAFFDGLRQLSSLGPAVIVLLHSGKGENSKTYRGSSDIKASIDIGFHLTNFGEHRLGRMRLAAFKTRFTVDTDFMFEFSNGAFLADNSPHAREKTNATQLTELLREQPGIKATEFEKRAVDLGITRVRARTFVRDGVDAGEIIQQRGKNNACFLSLAEEEGSCATGLF